MSANGGTPGRKRTARAADVAIIIDGVLEMFHSCLCQLCNEANVEEALKKAMKLPKVKAMLAVHRRAKVKGPRAKTGLVRSGYQVFTTAAMHALNAAGKEHSLTAAGALWNKLPAELRGEIDKRMGAIKARVNDKVASGMEADMLAELAAYEEDEGLAAFDFVDLMARYGHLEPQPKAKPKGGNPSPKPKPKPAAAPVAAMPTAAATPVAVPAAAPATHGGAMVESDKKKHKKRRHGEGGGEGGHKDHKKHKKDKKKHNNKDKQAMYTFT